MSKRSRHLADFAISGMRYWDGATVLEELRPGTKLELAAEPDNPVDADAVEIRYQGVKLGYVPREHNRVPALLLQFGHKDVIECRILRVDSRAEPWKQVHVGIYLTDHTDNTCG